jgi:hypothetical protein
MSGIVVPVHRSARGHGHSGPRANPKLFERDETDAIASTSESRFQCDERETSASGADSVRRTSVSNVLALVPNDNTAFVH